MAKFEPYLIAGAIVTVAVSTAVTLWAGIGVSWPYAALLALLLTACLVPLARRGRHVVRAADPADVMQAYEANVAGLSRRVQEIERRLVELDEKMVDTSRNTVRALAAELDSVGTVMRGLAEAVALHDAELFAPKTMRAPGQPLAEAPAPAAPVGAAPAAPEPASVPEPVVAAAREAETPRATDVMGAVEATAVEEAVRSGTIDMMLQAVVTIPQRRVRIYEAQGRVKLFSGRMIEPARVQAVAREKGLAAELGRHVLRQALRVARHLAHRNRDVPVLVPGGPWLLADTQSFRLLADVVSQDPAFASRILIQWPLAGFRDAQALEREVLEALHGLGLRFVLDSVPDLVLEGRSLAQRGVRFVRIPATVLMEAARGEVAAEIHPADLAGYLARHGITLIVEGVADEAMSVELFDFEIPLGIGSFYAPARAVRTDVLEDDPPALAPAQGPVTADFAPAAAPPRSTEPARAPRGPEGPDVEVVVDPAAATRGRGTPLRAFLRRTSG